MIAEPEHSKRFTVHGMGGIMLAERSTKRQARSFVEGKVNQLFQLTREGLLAPQSFDYEVRDWNKKGLIVYSRMGYA